MTYLPGLVAFEVTNESQQDVSRGSHRFPGDSMKVVVIPASEKLLIISHRDLSVKELDYVPEAPKEGDVGEVDRAFSFIKDQDQNVTNRSPGQSDDWLSPVHPESTALPALAHGRISELRLEKGAADRATELSVDIYGVSGTGEDHLITIRDVENAYEGVVPAPEAGVKGGADLAPRDEGVIAHLKADIEAVLATEAARKLAEEHGITITDVVGTGSGGNITVPDVRIVIEALAQHEAVEAEQREAIELQKEIDEDTPPPPLPGEPEPGVAIIGDPEGEGRIEDTRPVTEDDE